ncbi:hypothetical protein ABER99_21550 [Paenibacillus glucanolyticus]|jgi:polyhydroxyalkanoate synthesis regulator phasin|uniref:Methyl-accepting chemotaxis protein n=1 Tax=Paenibacillus glucanolyticus TaxID=59843 RepID=A0A163GTZ1_9BACL|nr:hypothetical protein [Paenibacillus glucanolyticus]KZS45150.1 hypothetical protein AWU65_03975 [Paenibacillus glucanolyticus]OMF64427.1 hypothetical protein BK142_31920 [Paenibacillus glucanolyticus]
MKPKKLAFIMGIASSLIIVSVLSVVAININSLEAKQEQRAKMVNEVIKRSDIMAEYARNKNLESVGWMININTSDLSDK